MKTGSAKRSKGSSTKKRRQKTEEQVVEVVTHNVDVSADSKDKLLKRFLDNAGKIRTGHDDHQRGASQRFDELEEAFRAKLNESEGGIDTNSLLYQIQQEKLALEKLTDDTVKEKQGLREQLADLKDELNGVRDQVSEVEIENNSYGVLADVERQVREARGSAELQGAKAAKNDLEDNIRRLHSDIKQGEKNREGVQRMIDDLKAKYGQAD